MNRITQAQYFATQEHVVKRGQLYGNRLPYTHHLEQVAKIVSRVTLGTEDMIVAAWLHDVIEDCPGVKAKDITEHFGAVVAGLVSAVTNEPGPNRKARHALTYPKIRETENAVIIKLADRLANVSAGGSLIEMYQKEHEEFRRQLGFKQSRVTANIIMEEAEDRLWYRLDRILTPR